MKIVHVISSCGAGGAEMFVKSLLQNLEQKKEVSKIELWIMTKIKDIYPDDKKKLKFEKKFVEELEKNDIKVKFIGKRPKKDWFKTTKRLRKLYKKFKPDIVHSHLESVTFHTCRGLSKYEVPIIQTIHSTVISHPLVQRIFIKRKIEVFVSISKKVSKIISKKLKVKKDNIYLIYNGVDVDKFKLNKRNIKNRVNNVISVGRLSKAKDHKNLFKAIKILKSKFRNKKSINIPKFLLVGDGALQEKLKELTFDLNISENVEFLGIRDDIPELLAKSDIYVMSSEWEGLSISLIEAVASEIPIVATNAGSNNEIVENDVNGKIVPIKNSEALAEELYNLIINFDLRKKFKNNSKKIIKKFEIEKSVKKHLKMYKEILKTS